MRLGIFKVYVTLRYVVLCFVNVLRNRFDLLALLLEDLVDVLNHRHEFFDLCLQPLDSLALL